MKAKSTNLPSIVVIGSGNLAIHLINQFVLHKFDLKQVYSRSDKNYLLKKYDNSFKVTSHFPKLYKKADLYIIAVNDDAIKDISETWPFELNKNQIIVHCSGSLSMEILASNSKNYGVFWPIQSLLKDKSINWDKIPICISSNNNLTKSTLVELGTKITKNIQIVSDEQRVKLHLIAVIVNNFTNHLYTLSEQYLLSNGLSFDVFLPILQETVERLRDHSPSILQTGPAIRNDKQTMEKHLELLKDDKDLKIIYDLLSKSITSFTSKI